MAPCKTVHCLWLLSSYSPHHREKAWQYGCHILETSCHTVSYVTDATCYANKHRYVHRCGLLLLCAAHLHRPSLWSASCMLDPPNTSSKKTKMLVAEKGAILTCVAIERSEEHIFLWSLRVKVARFTGCFVAQVTSSGQVHVKWSS